MLALYSTCPNPISVVIKKEAANWILVKQVLGATRSLSMDRNDMKDQAKVILEVAKRVKGGENSLSSPRDTGAGRKTRSWN